MKKPVLLFYLLILFSCQDNEMEIPNIDGKSFVRTQFLLDVPMDANQDGVFSHNLMDEWQYTECCSHTLNFNPDELIYSPRYGPLTARVEQNQDGSQRQALYGMAVDGIAQSYVQNGHQIEFRFYDGDLFDTGSLSEDGERIIFRYTTDNSSVFGNPSGGGRNILHPDGTVSKYHGNIVLIYTLVESD